MFLLTVGDKTNELVRWEEKNLYYWREMGVRPDAGYCSKMWCVYSFTSSFITHKHLSFMCRFNSHACTNEDGCLRMWESVHAFSWLFVFESERSRKSQRLSPNYLTHWWTVEVCDRRLVEEGGKKTERMNDGGRGKGRPLQDNSPDIGSFTDTGNAWPDTLRNVHSGPLVLKV